MINKIININKREMDVVCQLLQVAQKIITHGEHNIRLRKSGNGNALTIVYRKIYCVDEIIILIFVLIQNI